MTVTHKEAFFPGHWVRPAQGGFMLSAQRWRSAHAAILGVFLFLLLAGCAHVIPVQNDPDEMPLDYSLFKRPPEKSPHLFAVVIDEPTRKFTLTQRGTVFPVGEALFEQSSYTFSDIFRKYQVVTDRKSAPSGTDRFLVLTFGPGSAFRFGPTLFHEHVVEIHLQGEVSDGKGKRLWKGNVKTTWKDEIREEAGQQVTGQAGMFAFMAPNRNPQDVALGNLVHIGLTKAIEEMKYGLATKGRSAIR